MSDFDHHWKNAGPKLVAMKMQTRQAFLQWLVVALYLVLTGQVALADSRVALIIGQSRYETLPALKFAQRDAAELGQVLRRLEFHVTTGENETRHSLEKTFNTFVRRADDAEVALVFYLGHTLQANGKTWLLPVELNIAAEVDLPFKALRLDSLLFGLKSTGQLGVVMLDAADPSLAASKLLTIFNSHEVIAGPGAEELPPGVILFRGGRSGEVANVGEDSQSLWISALINRLDDPGKSLRQTLIDVRRQVVALSNGRQEPELRGSFGNDAVVLNGKESEKLAKRSMPAAEPPQPEPTNDAREAPPLARGNGSNGLSQALAELEKNALANRADKEPEPGAKPGPLANSPTRHGGDDGAGQLGQIGRKPVNRKVLARALQFALNRVGCSAGALDGAWGANSKKALLAFSRHSGIRLPELVPSLDTLAIVLRQRKRVCPNSSVAGRPVPGALSPRLGGKPKNRVVSKKRCGKIVPRKWAKNYASNCGTWALYACGERYQKAVRNGRACK